MRKIIIGDVHGCLEELQELIKKLELHEDDEVILLETYLTKDRIV